jgi:putative ABC transport system substrate-binding protein
MTLLTRCRHDSQGAKPAELPVEQPTKFELVINLTTATRSHRTTNLLALVDDVIE